MTKEKNIGTGYEMPKKKCTGDVHCPFHGEMPVHGRVFTGTVIKRNPNKTVTVEWPRIYYLQKFERYSKRRSKVKAHNPDCISAQVGDKVTIIETRPISKTKSFVVMRIDR
tara:strand:- start:53 stop:385 length:333 start_codon:yes stop_codon:yes gene_type:complete